jgi:hypothetical protein
MKKLVQRLGRNDVSSYGSIGSAHQVAPTFMLTTEKTLPASSAGYREVDAARQSRLLASAAPSASACSLAQTNCG